MENKVGTATWFDLPVSSLLDAMAFYEALLGWQYAQLKDSPETGYVMIRVGDTLIGGLRQTSAPPAVEGELRSPVLYFTVEQLAPKLARARELGAMLVGKTVDLGKGRGVYQWLQDRDRNQIALWASAL